MWEQSFTGGGTVPANDIVGVPSKNSADNQEALSQGFYSNGGEVLVTIEQTVESDGYKTIEFFFCDAQRG